MSLLSLQNLSLTSEDKEFLKLFDDKKDENKENPKPLNRKQRRKQQKGKELKKEDVKKETKEPKKKLWQIKREQNVLRQQMKNISQAKQNPNFKLQLGNAMNLLASLNEQSKLEKQ